MMSSIQSHCAHTAAYRSPLVSKPRYTGQASLKISFSMDWTSSGMCLDVVSSMALLM